MDKFLKDRTIWFYLATIAAIVCLIAALIFAIIANGDVAFSWLTVIGIIIAAAGQIVYVFLKKLDFLPIISCVGYALAIGNHFYYGLQVMSDVWNGVNFIGGTPAYFLVFAVIFALGTIISCVCAFNNQNK